MKEIGPLVCLFLAGLCVTVSFAMFISFMTCHEAVCALTSMSALLIAVGFSYSFYRVVRL